MSPEDVTLHLDVRPDGSINKEYEWLDSDGQTVRSNYIPSADYRSQFTFSSQCIEPDDSEIIITDEIGITEYDIYFDIIESILDTYPATVDDNADTIRNIFTSLHKYVSSRIPNAISRAHNPTKDPDYYFYYKHNQHTIGSVLLEILTERWGSVGNSPAVLQGVVEDIIQLEEEAGFWTDEKNEEEV
jgi:hypothetical protein